MDSWTFRFQIEKNPNRKETNSEIVKNPNRKELS